MPSAVRAAIACAVLSFAFHSTAHVARTQSRATIASTEKQIQAGKKLYASSCVFCHGADGNGTGAGPSLHKLILAADQIAQVVSEGNRAPRCLRSRALIALRRSAILHSTCFL